jgi:hypothetical protein
MVKTIAVFRGRSRSINTKSEINHKEQIAMAYDTNNNLVVSGYTAEAVVATDYSSSENSHFQVMKVAYGDSTTFSRVTSSSGLPVSITNASIPISGSVSASGTVVVSSVTNPISITGPSISIRSLTAGDPLAATASTSADFVRVVGYSGGWAVGVTATNFAIRSLTAGNPFAATANPNADFVRVIGYSGAFPIAVTGSSFDIRGLSFGKDSVSVIGGITIQIGNPNPYFGSGAGISLGNGFQDRILRASRNDAVLTTGNALEAYLGSNASVEDTVRVVGLSGAYPVSTLSYGLTAIGNANSRVPFLMNSDGSLFVTLAAGSIGVTASVTGLSLGSIIISGISLAAATSTTNAIQIHGYTGNGSFPVFVQGASGHTFATRLLSSLTDSIAITGDVRIASIASGSTVAVTTAFDSQVITGFTVNGLSEIGGDVRTVQGDIASISGAIGTASMRDANNRVKVSVEKIAQPTGGTSGKVVVPVNTSAAGTFPSVTLESGVHLKSALGNTTATIFIGFAAGVTNGDGYPLYNGDQIFIETNDLNKIFISSTASGATLHYIGT